MQILTVSIENEQGVKSSFYVKHQNGEIVNVHLLNNNFTSGDLEVLNQAIAKIKEVI